MLCPRTSSQPQDATKDLVKCEFPTTIQPGHSQVYFISLSGLATALLTCNDYVRDAGLVPYAKTGTNEIVSLGSQVGVAYAGYCQKLPGRGNR